MARQLDLDQLRCDHQDGQLAVAFGWWPRSLPASTPWAWVALCPDDLDACLDDPGFVYVRFRDDPADPAVAANDTADHADDDPALKFDQRAADNHGPG